jgi:hypothetical protein
MKGVGQVKDRVDHLGDVLLFVVGGDDYEAVTQGRLTFGSQIYGRPVINEDQQDIAPSLLIINTAAIKWKIIENDCATALRTVNLCNLLVALNVISDMSTTQRFQFLILFLLLPFPYILAQGPISGFPTPKGETAIAISYSQEVYDTYFLPDEVSESRDVKTISYSLFVETGLSENSSLVLTLPWMRTNDRKGSVQDGSVWLKYMNLEKRGERNTSRFFTAVGLSLPVGKYETTGIAALGQRATVFQGRLAYQFQHDDGWFLHGQTGIDFQFAPEAQSSWPLLLRTGYGGKFFYTEAWIEFVTALESGTGVQTATAGTGSSWNRIGGTLYFPIQPWIGLNLGAASVLNGTYIGKSGRVNIGLVFKLGGR